MNTDAQSSTRELVIVGAGGFGRETAQAVHALHATGAPWHLLGYIDDDPALEGQQIDGAVVLGGRNRIAQFPDASVVICTGRPGNYVSRIRIAADLDLPDERCATIAHPTAVISQSSSVGPGTVVLAHVTLTAAVRIGAHVAIMPNVTLTHDDVIDDFVTLASGVCLGGGVRIRKGAYVGAGAIIGEHLTVGAFSLIGMGSVVTHDVPPGEVWAGVPARRFRMADLPADLAVEQ